MTSKGNPEPVIRVGIVEDDERIRGSLVQILERAGSVRCIAACASAEEALRCTLLESADIILMDINLPGQSGIECLSELKMLWPSLQVVMLTVYEDTEHIFSSLKAGACGYLLKRSSPEELIAALRDV